MNDVMNEPSLRHAVSSLPAYVAGKRTLDVRTAALASNESHYPPIPEVLEVVRVAAGRMNRYPDIAAVELRNRIAEHVGVTTGEVAVGPGSVGVLQQLLAAVCDPGAEVLFAWRSFEAYPLLAEIAGATAVRVPLTVEEEHDFEAMGNAITFHTKIVIVCSPNNPTGVSVDHQLLREFIQSIPGRVLVVIDEAYVEYVDERGTLDSLALFREFPNVCVLRTFSKAYGLAGLRVGYAIAHEQLAEGLRRVALPFGVSTLAQQAAIVALDSADHMRERVASVVLERKRVTTALRAAGWSIPSSEANFLWIRADDSLREVVLAALESNSVLVRGYAGDGLRITLADRATNDRVVAGLGQRFQFGSDL